MKINQKYRRYLTVAGLILGLLLGAAGYTLFIKPNLNQDTYVYKAETVAFGDLLLGIMEHGSLTMEENSVMYDLDLDLSADDEDETDEEEETLRYLAIDAVYAAEGQRVTQGERLFLLNDDSVAAVERKLSAAVAEAQIALSEAQTEYNISLISTKETYDINRLAGSRANADYQATLIRNRESVALLQAEIKVLTQEITAAQAVLATGDLQEEIAEARSAAITAKELYEETDLHNSQAYLSNLSDYQSAAQTLEQLENELKSYQDTVSTNQTAISEKQAAVTRTESQKATGDAQARSSYESAQKTGELAADIYGYSTASLSDTVTAAQNDLTAVEEKYEAFKTFVGTDNTIYAPEDGLVIEVSYAAGDELTETGAMLTYAKADEYTVSISISEEDIAAVTVGEQVSLSFTAYPDTAYTGTIESITTSASADSATVSYPVTVNVDGDTALLFGGMTADVTFVTASVTDVVYVSRKAVLTENGQSYVYRDDGRGNREKAAVTTGFSDGVNIEITGGLNEGDTVYIESKMSAQEEETLTFDDSAAEPEGTATDSEGDPATDGANEGGFPEGGMPEGGFPEGDFSGGGFSEE